MFTFGAEVNAEKLAKICTRLFREYQIRKYYIYGVNDNNSTDIMIYCRASDNNRARLNDLKNLFARAGMVLTFDWDGSITKIGLKKKYRLIPGLAIRIIKLIVFTLEGCVPDVREGNLDINKKFKIPDSPPVEAKTAVIRTYADPRTGIIPIRSQQGFIVRTDPTGPEPDSQRYTVRWTDSGDSINGWESIIREVQED